MDEIDTMFINLLGEIDVLKESLETPETSQLERDSETDHFSFGFSNLRESLNQLEEQDLDNLVANLSLDRTTTTELTTDLTATTDLTTDLTVNTDLSTDLTVTTDLTTDLTTTTELTLLDRTPTSGLTTNLTLDPTPTSGLIQYPTTDLTPVQKHIPHQNLVPDQQFLPITPSISPSGTTPNGSPSQGPVAVPGPLCLGSPLTQPHTSPVQLKADKVRLALEKLKEARIKKRIVKVLMCDGSFKMLLVDERQSVGGVLDVLMEKTHCDRALDWSLCESNPELQTERIFEDHEPLVERLSLWGRSSKNTITFVSRPEKYSLFKDPQVFYMWRNCSDALGNTKEKDKQLLLKENFEGDSVRVPDLEGVLYQKESGKRKWNQRFFLLRASGIYYIPKGKNKSSIHLSCLVRFENVNIYRASGYKQRYRAPTDFCFVLKHPHLQQESEYTKVLCCEDKHTLSLWISSVRVAKYGAALYKNFQAGVQRSVTQAAPLHLLHCTPGAPPAAPCAVRSGTTPAPAGSTAVLSGGSTVCDIPGDHLPEPPPDFIPPAPRSDTVLTGAPSFPPPPPPPDTRHSHL
ncbi:amyloid beta A4 precursor protein-binding family B member 1-interacting protein-like [Gadus chalcogrammus]|uniref:amyloid beta A4 precursor protein-binding family B member 1-interacting protein-like n=1 Tax=Gadus chalcogrammus TaxID=1042646 RepID=UPI0024C49837|nr:amyloid beta A4 precursor protein-binding family B member 1-interacting protein-like [Gadus chalcogrammus]